MCGEIFDTIVLIYRHWAISAHSENLFDLIRLENVKFLTQKANREGRVFWPQGHSLIIVGRCPLGDATNQI